MRVLEEEISKEGGGERAKVVTSRKERRRASRREGNYSEGNQENVSCEAKIIDTRLCELRNRQCFSVSGFYPPRAHNRLPLSDSAVACALYPVDRDSDQSRFSFDLLIRLPLLLAAYSRGVPTPTAL